MVPYILFWKGSWGLITFRLLLKKYKKLISYDFSIVCGEMEEGMCGKVKHKDMSTS